MTSDRICPVCETPVVPVRGSYRIGDNDYHWKCYEQCLNRAASDQRQGPSLLAAARTSHHRGLGGRRGA